VETRAASLQSQAAAVQAAQAAALKQLDSFEASLKSKLEGQHKQVSRERWGGRRRSGGKGYLVWVGCSVCIKCSLYEVRALC
jgi:hypothetical protein